MATVLSSVTQIPSVPSRFVLIEPVKTVSQGQWQAQQVYGAATQSLQNHMSGAPAVEPLRRSLPIIDARIVKLESRLIAIEVELKLSKTPAEKKAYMLGRWEELVDIQEELKAIGSLEMLNKDEKNKLCALAYKLVGFHVRYFHAPHERPCQVFEKLSMPLQEAYVRDKYITYYALKDIPNKNAYFFNFMCQEFLRIVEEQRKKTYAAPGQYGLGIRDCAFGFFVDKELSHLMRHPLYHTLLGSQEHLRLEQLLLLGKQPLEGEPTAFEQPQRQSDVEALVTKKLMEGIATSGRGPVVPLNENHELSQWVVAPAPTRSLQKSTAVNSYKTWSYDRLPGEFDSTEKGIYKANAQTVDGLLYQLEQVYGAMSPEDRSWHQNAMNRARDRAEFIKQPYIPLLYQTPKKLASPRNKNDLSNQIPEVFEWVKKQVHEARAQTVDTFLITLEQLYKKMSRVDQAEHWDGLKQAYAYAAILKQSQL